MTPNTVSWDSIRDQVLSDLEVKTAYDALESEFNFARQVITLRKASGLTQREFADRVGIKQPQLARIESGKQVPKLETLTKLAAGAGYSLEIHFVPPKGKRNRKIEPLQISSKSVIHS
jgi:transcriptional regulator with XRE-family HTH domain